MSHKAVGIAIRKAELYSQHCPGPVGNTLSLSEDGCKGPRRHV